MMIKLPVPALDIMLIWNLVVLQVKQLEFSWSNFSYVAALMSAVDSPDNNFWI